MNAQRTVTAPMPAAPMRLPATPICLLPRPAEVADWSSERVRDEVAKVIAAGDAYDLCGHSDRVMRVCKEIEVLDFELGSAKEELSSACRVIGDQQTEMHELRGQLAAERDISSRLRNEANKLRVAIAKMQNERVTVALERMTVTLTNASSADITARLCDLGDDGDTVVIDVDSMDVDVAKLAAAS